MNDKYKEIESYISAVEGCGGRLTNRAKDLLLAFHLGKITEDQAIQIFVNEIKSASRNVEIL